MNKALAFSALHSSVKKGGLTLEYRELMRRLLYIAKLHRVLSGKSLAKMSPYAGQWMPTIWYVIDHDGCTQTELAAFLRGTPASVALATKRMQKAGDMEKEVDEYNLRRNKLHVTPLGKKLAADCKGAFDAQDRETFKGFTEEELETLNSYLDRIAMNMSGGRRLSFGDLLDMQKQKDEEQ